MNPRRLLEQARSMTEEPPVFSFAPALGLGLNALSNSQLPSLQRMFNDMASYGGNLNAMAQGQMFSPHQLMGGVFDPSTFVEGIGLAAPNIPTHPGLQMFQEFGRLQQHHQRELQSYRRDAEWRLQDAKERVFLTNHYELDDQGRMKIGDDGRPVLAEGPENQEQRVARLRWERQQQVALEQRHEAESGALRADSEAILNGWIGQGAPNWQEYQARTEAISAREQEVSLRQERERLLLLTAGLPDPDRPGQALGARVEEAFQGSYALRSHQEQVEMGTPAGQAIAAYMAQMQQFVGQQNAAIAAHRADEWDPNAMRNLRFG